MELSEPQKQFLEIWSEMAGHWGISRSMAQIHALLFLHGEPLDADTLMETLQISRGNTSMTLRNLLQWGLIHSVEVPESRKDFFIAEQDIWQFTANIIYERSKREILPVRKELQLLIDSKHSDEKLKDFYEKTEKLIEFLDLFETISEKLLPLVRHKNMEKIQALLFLLQK